MKTICTIPLLLNLYFLEVSITYIFLLCFTFFIAMHCANLDALVNVTNPLQQSSQQMTLTMSKNIIETKEEEDSRMLRMVLDISVLVLEGRLPECTSKRGYVEGPHCVLYPHIQVHRCDFNNYMVSSCYIHYTYVFVYHVCICCFTT